MKRRILLACVALSAMLSAMAQRSYTFNAAALNVDGLPNQEISAVVTTVNLNPDGKNEAGATDFCNYLANSNWDIVGLSEDFNFHNYVAAAPASSYYNFGKHSGSITTNITQAFTRAKIDGLGIAVTKRFTFTGDTNTGLQVQWSTEYGGSGLTNIGDNGADNMITKGFRMYTVTIATGVAVDVYVLHMDAHTADSDDDYNSNGKDKNIVAREAQLKQLADYIIANHNNRPVIIIGDTNCRYTREQLKAGFIDYINADSRLTINDPWVDLMWGGAYPEYGTGSLMTGDYGQKGEVVDKVFYINTNKSNLTLKANTYLWDKSVEVSDHKPVVVNFTLTDPNGTPLTDAEKENNWTLDESEAGNQKPKWEGEKVVSGTAYYLMNVGTGEYIKWGGAYYTEAVGGYGGTPITPITSDGGNTWVLKTSRNHVGDGDYTYLDQTGTWYLEPVNGTSYQYRIRSTRNLYLTANITETHKPIKSEAGNANDDKQKWIFLTDDRIRTEMKKATGEYPFNFTALLKSADFDVIEYEDGWTAKWTGFNQSSGPFMGAGTGWGEDPNAYSTYAYTTATTSGAATMSQNLGTLPNGTYQITFEGFYRAKYKKNWYSSETEETVSAAVKFGSAGSVSVKQNKNTDINSDAHSLFKNDSYATSGEIKMNSSGSVTLSVEMPKTTGSSRTQGWICVDNFHLMYYGTGQAVVDPYKEFKDIVCAKVNETYPKVMALNAAGQAVYDISVVIDRYNNNQITTGAIAKAMCDYVDHAYANALAAHNAYNVQQAIDQMQQNGGDLTGAIVNPSFETSDLSGWTAEGGGWDVNVYPNSNETFQATGCDGAYMFNSYGGDDGHTAYVKQTIKGVPNGLYELKVKVTSFADRYVYITGNGYHSKVATTQGKGVFHEATLYFLVEDGTATIGAVGGNKGGGSEFIHYWPFQGCFFKADNFRLKYICDVPHGRLKLALDEANAAVLDAYGKAALDLSSYQNAFTNKSLTGDGKAEVTEIYNELQAAAKAQRTKNADMTWAITNPNFETGDYTGWTCETGGDTQAASQENGTYTVAGADGRFLFNTWDNGTAKSVTQTVSGLTNGTYKLTAMVATDAEKSVTLTGNSTSTTIVASTNGNSSGVFPEVECKVTNGTLAITVAGVDDVWYKCDDFHLTLLSPSELILNETDKVVPTIKDETYKKVTVNRTIKANTWSTFVVPFDIPASMLGGWEVKELTKTEVKDNDDITLVFGDAKDGIKAGVPYMVRNQKDPLTQLSMENVEVNTTTMNSTTKDNVTFVGTYKNGYVPQGAFFISSNTFYQAEDNTNTLKAFRAYFTVAAGAKVRALSFRIEGEGTTAIDEVGNEATVVGIYTLGGVRINEMQQGVNILQMSDGSVVKVMIK